MYCKLYCNIYKYGNIWSDCNKQYVTSSTVNIVEASLRFLGDWYFTIARLAILPAAFHPKQMHLPPSKSRKQNVA